MVKLFIWIFFKFLSFIVINLKNRSRAANQGHNQNEWLHAQVNIKVGSTFRLVFKTQRYLNFYGDIGIDDISLDDRECESPDLRLSNIFI
jgi:hypothetical protein